MGERSNLWRLGRFLRVTVVNLVITWMVERMVVVMASIFLLLPVLLHFGSTVLIVTWEHRREIEVGSQLLELLEMVVRIHERSLDDSLMWKEMLLLLLVVKLMHLLCLGSGGIRTGVIELPGRRLLLMLR